MIDLQIQDSPSTPEPSGGVDVEEHDAEIETQNQTSAQEESIGDPVDWTQTPEALGDETQWDDEIELLD